MFSPWCQAKLGGTVGSLGSVALTLVSLALDKHDPSTTPLSARYAAYLSGPTAMSDAFAAISTAETGMSRHCAVSRTFYEYV